MSSRFLYLRLPFFPLILSIVKEYVSMSFEYFFILTVFNPALLTVRFFRSVVNTVSRIFAVSARFFRSYFSFFKALVCSASFLPIQGFYPEQGFSASGLDLEI